MERKGEGAWGQLVRQEKTQGNMASPKLRQEVASKQKAVVKQENSSLDFAQGDQWWLDKSSSVDQRARKTEQERKKWDQHL